MLVHFYSIQLSSMMGIYPSIQGAPVTCSTDPCLLSIQIMHTKICCWLDNKIIIVLSPGLFVKKISTICEYVICLSCNSIIAVLGLSIIIGFFSVGGRKVLILQLRWCQARPSLCQAAWVDILWMCDASTTHCSGTQLAPRGSQMFLLPFFFPPPVISPPSYIVPPSLSSFFSNL